MDRFERYAIYYAPEPGEFADVAAAWRGWDAVAGHDLPQPDLPGLPGSPADLTASPRKYGFHGTVKPPFRLACGRGFQGLHAAAAALCATLAPVTLDGLTLCRLGGFVALIPEGDQTALAALAADVVAGLDGYRAAPSETEIARRRPERLNPRQRAYLAQWGYPYVMEEFQFHLTLTSDLPEPGAIAVAAALAPVFTPLLPRPFRVNSLCLFGEAQDGRFHLLHRYMLTG